MRRFLSLLFVTTSAAWGQGNSANGRALESVGTSVVVPQSTAPVGNASTAESFGASPSVSAATNVSAIQNALNATGIVTISRCGTYSVNGPLVIKSNTRLQIAPCVQLFQGRGTNNNLVVNYAYTQRGYLSSKPTPFIFANGASGCGAHKTVYVAFTNGSGTGGYGSIQTNASGVPTGLLTIINPGAYYSSTAPTQGAIYNSTGSYACSMGGTNSSPATFSGGGVTNPIAAVALTWNSSSPEEVTVNWSGHPFYNSGKTLTQQAYVTVWNASPSAFNGTFLVETVPSSSTFTYRLRRNPGCSALTCNGSNQTIATDHGTSVVAMQADQNIIIDGGSWNYNGTNNSAANGLNVGNSIIFFAVENVEIRNLNFIQPKQDAVFFAAVTDAHVHDSTDEGNGAVQFFECQGPCYNVDVDHISTTGWDDGMTFISRTQPGFYSNIILSYGDVQNSGFSHINRVAPNDVPTQATGEVTFYASQTEYTGGIYARDIGGSMYTNAAAGGVDISCVALTAGNGAAVIDTADIENINGTCTWAVRVTGNPVNSLTVNHVTMKNITCNPQNSGYQAIPTEGEECVQFFTYATIGKAEVEKLNYSTTAHAKGNIYAIEDASTIGELS